MATVARTYNFVDGTTAYGSEVEIEIATLSTAHNNHDSGASSWTVVKGATIEATTLLKGKGTATNDDAAAGYIGEYIESNQTSTVNAPTSTQLGDLTSISLTAGDWYVTGNVSWTLNGATATVVDGGISVTSGNSATGLTFGVNRFQGSLPVAAFDSNIPIASYRLSLSATTTVYLKYSSTYTGGPPKGYGSLRAERRR